MRHRTSKTTPTSVPVTPTVLRHAVICGSASCSTGSSHSRPTSRRGREGRAAFRGVLATTPRNRSGSWTGLPSPSCTATTSWCRTGSTFPVGSTWPKTCRCRCSEECTVLGHRTGPTCCREVPHVAGDPDRLGPVGGHRARPGGGDPSNRCRPASPTRAAWDGMGARGVPTVCRLPDRCFPGGPGTVHRITLGRHHLCRGSVGHDHPVAQPEDHDNGADVV